MESENKQQVIEKIQGFRLPRYDEIPDVGLYLEQVTKYICSYLDPFNGITLTPSMISNYVKKHLIDNPHKKRYSREQIAYLIYIAVAKSVLSLDQIAVMLELQKQSYECHTAYDYFCEQFERVLLFVFGCGTALEKVGSEVSGEKTMLRNTIITVAHKIYLDYCFGVVYSNVR